MKVTEIKKILDQHPSQAELAAFAFDERESVKKLLLSYERKQQMLEKEKEHFFVMQKYERELWDKGCKYVAGVDEAGRGPLAGPLVVAAAILPDDAFIGGLDDSKKLSEKKRESLYDEIKEKAVAINVQIIPTQVIDALNIYQATYEGMKKALLELDVRPDAALTDAMPLTEMPFDTISIIRGDALSVSIAAASIMAKVTRDRIMTELDDKYPEYGFKKHKGYGTKEHIEAIYKYGPTIEHRRSFEPVKSMAGS